VNGPLLALRGAVFSALVPDATLAALMGGIVRLYDEPPRAAEPVYAVFGDAEARDAGVDGANRARHRLEVAVWARPGSARGAIEVAERMALLLDGAALEPVGHRLILMRAARLSTARDGETNLARVVLTLEAVTEAA
jgi:hypothetical protein